MTGVPPAGTGLPMGAATLIDLDVWQLNRPHERAGSSSPSPSRSTSVGTRRCVPYFAGDVSLAAVAAKFGYTRATLASLVRDHRGGKLDLFAPPGRPGPKSALPRTGSAPR